MASVWIRTRQTKIGTRYRVEYRPGGRDTATRFAGSFRTRRLATLRAAAVERELAELRIPDLELVEAEGSKVPTLAEAAEAWRASRVDVTEGTRTLHRVALGRALPTLGAVCVDELTVEHFVELVATLAAAGAKRERSASCSGSIGPGRESPPST
jgi:hypothetical protein